MSYAINSLVVVEPNKLLFQFLPSCVRALIPIRFWPSFCHEVTQFFDFVIEDLIEPHAENWDINEPPRWGLDFLRKDLIEGKITEVI